MKHLPDLCEIVRLPTHFQFAAVVGLLLATPVAMAVDADNNGLPDDWELAHSGTFSAWPSDLNQTLLPYSTAPRSFLLNNDTSAVVTYTATLSNNTVALYDGVDSITGGVTYGWDEISATGTLLAAISNADDASEPVTITGFTFPFFGTAYSQVYVSSNGLLSFSNGNSSPSNTQIPGPNAPENTIAAFWDDLDTRTTGTIYYKQEATRLIIQFQSVGRYGGSAGNYTFQAVLHSTGKIELRYKTMTGLLNSASVGVEGGDSTLGYGVVNNAAYVVSSLALRIDPTSKFFSIATLTGSVPAHTVGNLGGLFHSLNLPPGNYTANVSISHAGSGPSPLALTANLTVPDQPGAISITSPAPGSTAMQGTSVWIQTTATDPDGLEKVEFYDGTTKLGETPAYPGNDYYNFDWYLAENGQRSITAKAIDFFGGVTLSTPVLFNSTANNDFDGMPDSWEIANYLDPYDPTDGEIDADTDGYTNLEEYLFGTNPQLAEDTDFDGMPDGWEYHNQTDLNVDDSGLDTDSDGLTNLEEYWYGTNPRSFDTDGDLLPDLYEIENWLDPRVASGEDDGDMDGLTNIEEYLNQTNPNDPDSDGDGATDGVEVGQGSDPNNPADGGNPPADPLESIEFKVGGDYASWRMEIKALGPRDTRTLLVVSPAPNQWETKSHKLWKNNKYEITMHHTGSRPQDDPPWYCWEGSIDGLPNAPTFQSLPDWQLGARTSDGKYFMLKNHWVVDNVDGLLASHLHSKGVNHVSGKKAILAPVETEVNETRVAKDDLVPVSLGTDEDLATDFSVKISGISGLTAALSLRDSDGNLKFKEVDLTLADGVKSKTKLWGITPSSARDTTFIKTTLKKGSEVIGYVEEDVTVFKGVKLEFGGNYYINVDTREKKRLPWDGRTDTKPNSHGSLTGDMTYMNLDIGTSPSAAQLANYKKAVDQSAGFGYQSAISFNDGDNSVIPLYKPWKGSLDVKAAKIYSKAPAFELTDDPLINEKIKMKKGVLDGLPDGNEQLLDPQIEITNYFTLNNTTATTRIAGQALVAATVSTANIQTQIAAEMSKGYDELLAYFNTRPSDYSDFSGYRFEWKNETFAVQKGTSIKNSFAAKSIRGEKENGGKVEAKWIFGGWNEFKFVGKLEGATIETK